MKKNTKKNILGTMAGFAGLLICMLPPTPARAGTAAERIEGVWISNVTIKNCSSGVPLATFKGLGTFIRGGALLQTNNMNPALASPSMGRWDYQGDGLYTATFQFFRFDSTGAWTGVQKVSREIQLARGGATFTSTISFTTFDVSGNVVATGCGTEAATRVVD